MRHIDEIDVKVSKGKESAEGPKPREFKAWEDTQRPSESVHE